MNNQAEIKPKKIAILGGGLASLTTALELTNQSGWQTQYEITIYQLGWRLGGKLATGRRTAPTENMGSPDYRIQEHGLHIFLGFYRNVFKLLKQCYEELGPDGPFSSIEDVFIRQNLIVFERYVNDEWVTVPFNFPENSLLPWDSYNSSGSSWDHLCRFLKWLAEISTQISSPPTSTDQGFPDLPRSIELLTQYTEVAAELLQLNLDILFVLLPNQIQSLKTDSIFNFFEQIFLSVSTEIASVLDGSYPSESIFASMAATVASSLKGDPKSHPPEAHNLILTLLEKFENYLKKRLEKYINTDTDIAWKLELINLGIAVTKGLFQDQVIQGKGLNSIDDYEFREWLRKHGADEAAINSMFVKVIYDLVFAFPKGNTTDPQLAAGIAVRIWITIIFEYYGSVMWKFRAGTADVAISPIYLVLKRRGVKFKFFHWVDKVHLDQETKTQIQSIGILQQVNLKDPDREYEPLIEVKGMKCWPDQPLYDQIENPDQIQDKDLESPWSNWEPVSKLTLERGRDFDLVVIGMSIASLPYSCKELIENSQAWQKMTTHIQTVPTQGGQLWLKPTLQQLGWPITSPVLSAYVQPLDTYADMSELIPQENWPAHQYPYSCAYFTGVISDPGMPPMFTEFGFPERVLENVQGQAVSFLNTSIGHFWPKGTRKDNPQGLDWNLLVDDVNNGSGIERFYAQFWRVNISPSERYVLSVPGSTKYRLKPNQSGYKNLYLTGDWTDTHYNSGCVEATTISGMLAAKAIVEEQFNMVYAGSIVPVWLPDL